jgi:anti-anti-sigma factor
MEITVTQNQGIVPVTILHVEGRLDGSNYELLIAQAQELYASGIRNLLLDLSKLTFLSSAGISALHRVAKLFHGTKSAELEEGWAEFRAIDRDRDAGVQKRVKLLNPSAPIRETLDLVGFTNYFEIYADANEAVSSFQ